MGRREDGASTCIHNSRTGRATSQLSWRINSRAVTNYSKWSSARHQDLSHTTRGRQSDSRTTKTTPARLARSGERSSGLDVREERAPGSAAEDQHRPRAPILRVPDTDCRASPKRRHLNAIPVVGTPRTLPPARLGQVGWPRDSRPIRMSPAIVRRNRHRLGCRCMIA